MLNSQEIITLYEDMSDITGKMLTAARAGDWDHLVTLETHCSDRVQSLKRHEPPMALSGAARERKVKIIHKILADDREIRNLTAPWMAKLSNLINSTHTERKLSSSYGGT